MRQHLCETVAHPAVEGIAATVEIQQDDLAIAVPWDMPPPIDPPRNGGGNVVDIIRLRLNAIEQSAPLRDVTMAHRRCKLVADKSDAGFHVGVPILGHLAPERVSDRRCDCDLAEFGEAAQAKGERT